MDFGQESGDMEAAYKLVFDYESVGFAPEDVALCEFAIKLSAWPGAMAKADVQTLRDHGFSDDAISIAAQVVGYFNYINRIADGLGVDPEEEMAAIVSEREWRERKRGDGDVAVFRRFPC